MRPTAAAPPPIAMVRCPLPVSYSACQIAVIAVTPVVVEEFHVIRRDLKKKLKPYEDFRLP